MHCFDHKQSVLTEPVNFFLFYRINSRMLLELLNDMETLLASDSHFLLGKWIAAAKSWATDISESFNLEFNARNQITLWGPRGEVNIKFIFHCLSLFTFYFVFKISRMPSHIKKK